MKNRLAKLVALAAIPKAVAAQVAVQDILDEFYEDFATEASGRYWWWCRMVLLEPNELIVDDGENNLYRVPFAIEAGADEDADGDPNVTFGEPVPVRIEYVDVAARAEQVAAACHGIEDVRGEKVAAKFTSREESRLNANEGGTMREHIEALRKKLGLAADVKDEEVLAKAAAHLEADPDGGSGGSGEGEGGADGEGQGDGSGENGGGATPETPAPDGELETLRVDSGALRELQEQAAQGVAARQEQIRQADDAALDRAVKLGKIPPSRRDHFAKLLKLDREGTLATLDELAENVIPVGMRGANGGNVGESASNGRQADIDAFLRTHMPDVASRKQALLTGADRPRVTIAD